MANQRTTEDTAPKLAVGDGLWDTLYQRLKAIAGAQLRGESTSGDLQPTMLVNEAWLRMADLQMQFQSREHFLAMAATVMRRVLVDQARAAKAAKRDARLRVTFSSALVDAQPDLDVLAVHEAIDELADHDARKADVVERFYFGGMTYAEIAATMDVSDATVKRELRTARAWLMAQLSDTP